MIGKPGLQLWIFLMFAALAGYGLVPGFTAQPSRAQAQDIIDAIVVEGYQRIEPETVISYMPVKAGDAFDDAAINQALKTLFDTGLFADVAMQRRGQSLVVQVVENPIISRIAFEGNDYLDDEELGAEIELTPRTVFTRAKAQADTQRLIDIYRRSGRFSSTVEPKVIELDQNRVDLVFEIAEGPVTDIQQINFVGNVAFDDGDLRGEISTRESRWWRFLSSSDRYDPDRLNFDKELLRRFYLRNGYADFRMISAVAELTRDRKDFFVTFTLEEGEVYTFGPPQISSSLENIDAETLMEQVTTGEGETYDISEIDESVDALTFEAGRAGFAFVEVRPRILRDAEARTIAIDYLIDEGPRVYVERINVTGNSRTLDRVIRREFGFVEGDVFNRVLLERARRNIGQLGFFAQVDVSTEQGSAPDKVVINVNVQEQSTGELSLGVGISSNDPLVGDIRLTERNLLGRGQELTIGTSLGFKRQQIDLHFTEPYFMGRKVKFGFDVFGTDVDRQNESSFSSRTTGGGIRFGFPLTENSSLDTYYSFKIQNIRNVPTTAAAAVAADEGVTNISEAGYTYKIHSLNDRYNGNNGWSVSFRQSYAGLGGDTDYLLTELRGRKDFEIMDDVIFGLLGSAGYMADLTDNRLRVADRFFKGGTSFRGFQSGGIGPRDTSTGDAIGGRAYAIGTAEARFPLGILTDFGIEGGVFSDFGTLFDVPETTDGTQTIADDASLRASIGFSVFWDSPMGPLQLDFSEALLKEDYDKTEFFRFGISTRF